MPPSSRSPLLAALIAPVVLLGLTGRPGVWLGRPLIGGGTADVWGHTWGYWWTARSLTHGRLPFMRAPVNHPQAQSWWVIDLPVAAILTPITEALGAGAAYNLAFALHAAIGAAAIAALILRRGGRPWVGVMAGVVAATSPFVRGALVSGVPEALAVLLVPLLVLLLDAGLAGRRRHLLGAAALAVVLVLDGAYSAIAGALAGTAALVAAVVGSKERMKVLARSAAVALPAGLALFGLHTALQYSQHPAMDRAEERMVDIGAAWALQPLCGSDLASWSVPAQLLPLVEPATGHRHIVYVGLLLPVLLGVAAWRHKAARRPALLALAAGVVALGPALYVFGTARSPAVLPGTALWMAGATNLYRLAGLVPVMGLIGLACLRHKLVPVAIVAVALEWLVGAPLPLRIPTTADPASEVETWLAAQTDRGAVIDLPFDREGSGARGPWPQRTFYLQSVHQRPIASALYRPTQVNERSRSLSMFDRAITRAWRQESVPQGGRKPQRPARIPPPPSETQQVSLNQKVFHVGFRYVTLDLDLVRPYQRADAQAWLTAWLGEAEVVSSDEMRLVWTIPEAPEPPPPPEQTPPSTP